MGHHMATNRLWSPLSFRFRMLRQQPTANITKATLKPTVGLPVPSRRYFYLALLILAVLGLFIGHKMERTDLSLALQAQREETLREASLLASRIQSETNSTFYLIVGLGRLIEINGGISDKQFKDICSELVRSRPGLLNIAAAPDMVIRHVYPIKGNEAAMGLDYAKLPNQREAAFRVKESGQPVIAGPISLVQGGEAVIGRFPVYIQDLDTKERKFWGIISTPFDTAVLYEEVGLTDPSLDLEVSLWGRDSLGADGDVFFGDPKIDAKNPVYFPIELLSGSWQMAAIPKGGWLQTAPHAWLIRITTTVVTILLGLLIWLYYLHSLKEKRIHEAEHAAIRTKERFYANMSHELRTPLNGICGLSEIIENSAPDPEVRGFAKVILRSAETLTRLLDDVLKLSRNETDAVEYTSFALEPFLSELLPPLEYEAQSKGVKLILEPLPKECAQIRSNSSMLRQILWNLLSNAVKFTESGSVTLKVDAHADGTLTYRITDTGIGIAADKLEAVFRDFVQEDDSDTRHFGGAGLGLAVVQRFVTRLDGSVTVKSEKGHGSEFTVKLPN